VYCQSSAYACRCGRTFWMIYLSKITNLSADIAVVIVDNSSSRHLAAFMRVRSRLLKHSTKRKSVRQIIGTASPLELVIGDNFIGHRTTVTVRAEASAARLGHGLNKYSSRQRLNERLFTTVCNTSTHNPQHSGIYGSTIPTGSSRIKLTIHSTAFSPCYFSTCMLLNAPVKIQLQNSWYGRPSSEPTRSSAWWPGCWDVSSFRDSYGRT